MASGAAGSAVDALAEDASGSKAWIMFVMIVFWWLAEWFNMALILVCCIVCMLCTVFIKAFCICVAWLALLSHNIVCKVCSCVGCPSLP